jgi:hypothetical protein
VGVEAWVNMIDTPSVQRECLVACLVACRVSTACTYNGKEGPTRESLGSLLLHRLLASGLELQKEVQATLHGRLDDALVLGGNLIFGGAELDSPNHEESVAAVLG